MTTDLSVAQVVAIDLLHEIKNNEPDAEATSQANELRVFFLFISRFFSFAKTDP